MSKRCVLSAACLLVSVSAAHAAPGTKDFDFACAVVSSAAMGGIDHNSEEGKMLFNTFSFYLGRLTVRDTRTHWRTAIMGRVAELHERSSGEVVAPCLDFFDSFLAPLDH
jgi:hypothetical protein